MFSHHGEIAYRHIVFIEARARFDVAAARFACPALSLDGEISSLRFGRCSLRLESRMNRRHAAEDDHGGICSTTLASYIA